jgi:hypothetical protein
MTTRDERVGDDGYPCQSANITKGETPQCDQALDAEPG